MTSRGRSDVRDLARDVMRHRLVLSYEALAEDVSADDLLDPDPRAAVPTCPHEPAARDRRHAVTAWSTAGRLATWTGQRR